MCCSGGGIGQHPGGGELVPHAAQVKDYTRGYLDPTLTDGVLRSHLAYIRHLRDVTPSYIADLITTKYAVGILAYISTRRYAVLHRLLSVTKCKLMPCRRTNCFYLTLHYSTHLTLWRNYNNWHTDVIYLALRYELGESTPYAWRYATKALSF